MYLCNHFLYIILYYKLNYTYYLNISSTNGDYTWSSVYMHSSILKKKPILSDISFVYSYIEHIIFPYFA